MNSESNSNVMAATPELLAPAGTLDAGLAAFDAGADAVYAGLPRFNARERGRNLCNEDLARLLGYARCNDKRVYLTLNTLVKEQELPEVADILADLLLLRPHAVIVQDLALVRMIREYFPELPVHASTQMGIHNSAGISVLQKLGVERVILQRQVTLAELQLIKQRVELEIEIFVHGALCCCQSGHCLFSSWLGGWSGNRGKCKQPCRRRFFSEHGNGFFFSTNDLCLIDLIPAIRRLQPAALKIEGRLRTADYVSKVVRAYRLVLDSSAADEKEALSEARQLLAGSYGRKWSHGFWTREEFAQVIEHRSLGSSGRLSGRVVKLGSGGFTAELKEVLTLGDLVRVQPRTGTEGPSLQITRLAIDRKTVKRAYPGQVCFIFCDKEVPAGGLLFKTAAAAADFRERIRGLPVPQAAVALQIKLDEKGLTVQVPAVEAQWQKQFPVAAARKHILTSEDVQKEFCKGAGPRFMTADISVAVGPGLFLPASVLKKVRREFWDWAEDGIDLDHLRRQVEQRRQSLTAAMQTPIAPPPTKPRRTILLKAGAGPEEHDGVIARQLAEFGQEKADEWVLPAFCPETELDNLAMSLSACMAAGAKCFRITALYQLHFFRHCDAAGLQLTASFPLPVANSLAAKELLSHGIDRFTAWVELEKEAMEALEAAAPARVERFTFGRLPLLSTRAELPVEGEITDARGERFTSRCENGLTLLLPGKIMKIPAAAHAAEFIDLSHVNAEEAEQHDFNYRHTLM